MTALRASFLSRSAPVDARFQPPPSRWWACRYRSDSPSSRWSHVFEVSQLRQFCPADPHPPLARLVVPTRPSAATVTV